MTETVQDHAKKVSETLNELEGILQTVVLNDSMILDALAQMLTLMQQTQARAEENQVKLQSELKTCTSELIETNRRILASQSLRVASSDPFAAENPEVSLLTHLYSFLPDNRAIDVGANVGSVSKPLLDAGYEVYAFEPYPPSFQKLMTELGNTPAFHGRRCAVGAADGTMQLYIASDLSHAQNWNPSLFHSLVEHPMLEEVQFTESIPVDVRSLASLQQSGEIPESAGLLKIDTEGFDLEVIRGMGGSRYPVVMTEFWDSAHPFGLSGHGRLEDTVREMKQRGYGWHIVIYHVDELNRISFYCNRRDTVPKSWGNAIFFRDHNMFLRGLNWCEEAMQMTWHK